MSDRIPEHLWQAIEWDCEGCGVHVVSLGIETVPAHRFCDVCAWIDEFISPAEIETVRRFMGEVSERRFRGDH